MSTTDKPTMTWEEAVAWLRAQPDKMDLVRACFFDDPLQEAAKRFWESSEWIATRALLPVPPGRSLDLGAGRGITSYALSRDGWTVTAVEPDPSELVGAGAIRSLAAIENLSIEVVAEWGETLPFADATFDVVLCRQVLHHARNLKALCAQIARVLKPGGIMVATREHVISKREDLPMFLASHDLHHLYGGENAYLLDEYLEAICQGPLRLIAFLNPLQSDINLYPMSIDEHRLLVAKRFHVPQALVGKWIMVWLGNRLSTPGRLYTFIAEKPANI